MLRGHLELLDRGRLHVTFMLPRVDPSPLAVKTMGSCSEAPVGLHTPVGAVMAGPEPWFGVTGDLIVEVPCLGEQFPSGE